MKMGMEGKAGASANIEAKNALLLAAMLHSDYNVECWRKGELVWTENIHNLITTEGKNHVLDTVFAGGTPVTTWYIGLIDSVGYTALDAGDTAAQINGTNGWDELSEYDEATRVAYVEAAAAAGSMDNSASVATFTISATKTCKGAFLASASAKDATTGTLYGEALFASDRDVIDDDIIKITITLSL